MNGGKGYLIYDYDLLITMEVSTIVRETLAVIYAPKTRYQLEQEFKELSNHDSASQDNL